MWGKNATGMLRNLTQQIDFKTRNNHNQSTRATNAAFNQTHTHTESYNPPLQSNQLPRDEKVKEIAECSLWS